MVLVLHNTTAAVEGNAEGSIHGALVVAAVAEDNIGGLIYYAPDADVFVHPYGGASFARVVVVPPPLPPECASIADNLQVPYHETMDPYDNHDADDDDDDAEDLLVVIDVVDNESQHCIDEEKQHPFLTIRQSILQVDRSVYSYSPNSAAVDVVPYYCHHPWNPSSSSLW